MIKANYKLGKFQHKEEWDVSIPIAVRRARALMTTGVCKYVKLTQGRRTLLLEGKFPKTPKKKKSTRKRRSPNEQKIQSAV